MAPALWRYFFSSLCVGLEQRRWRGLREPEALTSLAPGARVRQGQANGCPGREETMSGAGKPWNVPAMVCGTGLGALPTLAALP